MSKAMSEGMRRYWQRRKQESMNMANAPDWERMDTFRKGTRVSPKPGFFAIFSVGYVLSTWHRDGVEWVEIGWTPDDHRSRAVMPAWKLAQVGSDGPANGSRRCGWRS